MDWAQPSFKWFNLFHICENCLKLFKVIQDILNRFKKYQLKWSKKEVSI